jgi:hypothetical protein
MTANKSTSKSNISGRPRSAVTGRYVTKPFALRNPRTTVVEKPTTKRRGTK